MKKLFAILTICICLNTNAHTFGSKLKPIQDTVNFNNYKEPATRHVSAAHVE